MRLEEWQKWIDSQFLDEEQAAAEAEARAAAAAAQAPAAQQPPVSEPIVPAAPQARAPQAVEPPAVQQPPAIVPPAVAPAKAPEPAPQVAVEPAAAAVEEDEERPGAIPPEMASALERMGNGIEMPSLDRYLPFLRGKKTDEEPAPEPETEGAPEPAALVEVAVIEAVDDTTATEAPPAEPGPVQLTLAEATAEETGFEAMSEATEPDDEPAAEADSPHAEEQLAEVEPSDGDATPQIEMFAGEVPPAPVRREMVHRRARHARNVRPDEVMPDLDSESLWNLVPKHIQVLVSMDSADEVTQNSYKRPFRESRIQLIERLLDPSLSLEDTARLLGVCPTTVRRYTNKGLLTHQRTKGDQRRFKLSDVLAFLEAQSKK